MTRPRRRGNRRSKVLEGVRPPAEGEWVKRDAEVDMNNSAFESYYKMQRIVPDEEWDAMMQSFREPLPSTFRISTHKSTATSLNKIIKSTFIPEMEKSTFEGEAIPIPKPLPWFPGGLAWQISLPRKYLRKAPEYRRFHNFLVYESEAGNIARQEAVSMIPPLFLDVRPNHHVLDMCAAPGSKTAQLLEALQPVVGSSAEQSSELSESLLVANDSDHKRAQLLVHTTARRACPSLMVTSVDASIFPAIYLSRGGKDGAQVRYDRILADVPCSGDGTLRKNVGIWKTWSAKEGNGLHSLQLRILRRAMTLLKDTNTNANSDTARIVYSTCSLNPVENEAVIAAALVSNPEYELVDVSSHLQHLKRRPGLTKWCPPFVRSKGDVAYFDTYAEYVQSSIRPGTNDEPTQDLYNGDDDKTSAATVQLSEQERSKTKSSTRKMRLQERNKGGAMLESMWPPGNVEGFKLQRCMRFYPQLQDTGGFFVAVLQRKHVKSSSMVSETVTGNLQTAPVDDDDDDDDDGDDAKSIGLHKLRTKLREGNGEPAHKKARKDDVTVVSTIAHETGKATSKRKQVSSDAGGTYKENPFTFVDPVESGVRSNLDSLDLLPHFPLSNLYMRNPPGAPIRQLYLVNNVVKSIMHNTEPARIRLVSAGVKVLGKSDLSRKRVDEDGSEDGDARDVPHGAPNQGIQFRVMNEGLHALFPFLKRERFLKGDSSSLRTLLQRYYPLCVDFEEPFRSAVEAIPPGSHVISFSPGWYGRSELVHELYLPLWKSGVSVSMMVDKQTKSALSLQLFGEDVTVAAKAHGDCRLAGITSGTSLQ